MSPGTSSRASTIELLPVADDARLVAREPAKRLQRALGAALLEGADDGVEEHDGEDDHRVAALCPSASAMPAATNNR